MRSGVARRQVLVGSFAMRVTSFDVRARLTFGVTPLIWVVVSACVADATRSTPLGVPLAAAPVSAEHDAGIEELAAPSAACTLAAKAWSGELRLGEGGPVFARAYATPATMRVPTGVVARSGHVTVVSIMTLRGVVDDPAYFLTHAVAFGGFAVPRATTRLPVVGVERGKVVASLDVGDVFAEPRTLHQPLVCEDLAIVHAEYDARTFLTPTLGPGKDAWVRQAGTLSLAPGGPPVARLRPDLRGAVVVLGREEKRALRVLVDASTFVAVGWAEARAIDQTSASFLEGLFVSDPVEGGIYLDVDHASVCSHELSLIAQVGRARRVVGSLPAGSRFVGRRPQPAAVSPDDLVIDVPQAKVAMSEGALLLIKRADLTTCLGRFE